MQVRAWEASSAKVTSRTWCRPFSRLARSVTGAGAFIIPNANRAQLEPALKELGLSAVAVNDVAMAFFFALMTKEVVEATAIRPFQVSTPDTELTELRRRITATRFPEKETVTDFSQGVPLATTQKLARYWATEYDWRKVEARLNAVPNFITEIDGLDIHFIHVRSKHENALPMLVSHGWPGSIIEQLKIVEDRKSVV